MQADLFTGSLMLQTRVITRRKDFDDLFQGFSQMKAVSYVVSPDLLLDFFDELGYQRLEIIVGENLTESYKQSLEQKGLAAIQRMAEMVERGILKIYMPGHTIHTKLYLLERADCARIIQTSANLTVTAQEARRQTNYAWYLDLTQDNPLLEKVKSDYEMHLHGCSLFMGDLKDILAKNPDQDRKLLIEAWLRGSIDTEEQNVEIRNVFHELSSALLQSAGTAEETITLLHLPESEVARKRVEKQLMPLKPVAAGQNQVTVNKAAFVRYVYETHRVPLMLLSVEKKELLLGIDGELQPLTQALPEPEKVDGALKSIESYMNTVDIAESSNPLAAKTSMYEALLYLFSAPFANEYMQAKRARYGIIDTRGPRFLYIYGPTQNGKTTFLRYVLKLLTGRFIEALSRQDFTRTRIANAMLTGTAFPLVFDDVDPSRTTGMEDVFKSYWERWWKDGNVSPQIVITSNTPRLKDWAKSRVKRIDFDVHFVPTETAKEQLARLFMQDNELFKWFAFLFINELSGNKLPVDDELKMARNVMLELYQYARRSLPNFFPSEPIEKLYDPGRKDWQDLLYGLRKASIQDEGKRKLITFAKDMQHWEINDYQGYLPQTVKHQRRGNTIIVENPKEFDRWMGESAQSRSMLSRLFKR